LIVVQRFASAPAAGEHTFRAAGGGTDFTYLQTFIEFGFIKVLMPPGSETTSFTILSKSGPLLLAQWIYP
jgi:hypothetical protein